MERNHNPSAADTLRIGVAGCGNMGLPMLQTLDASGFDCRGYDIRPLSDYSGSTGLMVESPSDFKSGLDVVISVVRDYEQTLELCFQDQRLFYTPPYPRYLVVSSTLATVEIRDLDGRLPASVELVDAPMSGAPVAARNGTLSFMVGAKPPAFDELQSLFRAMGAHVHHCGPAGSGMAAKVLNNYVAAASVVAVRRVLDHAENLGLGREKLLQVMSVSSGSTWYGNNFDSIDWAREGHAPHNTMAILEKDVRCAISSMGLLDPEQAAFDASLLDALRVLESLD